jgi:hypothetical protein
MFLAVRGVGGSVTPTPRRQTSLNQLTVSRDPQTAKIFKEEIITKERHDVSSTIHKLTARWQYELSPQHDSTDQITVFITGGPKVGTQYIYYILRTYFWPTLYVCF